MRLVKGHSRLLQVLIFFKPEFLFYIIDIVIIKHVDA